MAGGLDFRTTSVADLAQGVRAKSTSARELAQAALENIERLNPIYNAFVAVDAERALAQAAALDERIAEGHDPGPLAGIPIGVKDTHGATGFTTTHGSPMHADDPAATEDDPFVARLRAAGCIVLGKTNTPEFAWCGNTTNPVFGDTVNPWHLEHGPGGSSGGAAAALAAGLVPLATGSDGGGSIRIPSAVCGLSGMKPSLGRVPSGGPRAPGWLDLSTNGPMARTIADVALALDTVVGPDPTDLRSLPRPEASWLAAIDHPHVPVSVAWSPTLGYGSVDAEVMALCQHAVATLESLGAEVTTVDTVFDHDPVDDFLTLMGVCQLRTMRPLMEHARWGESDPILRMLVEGGQSVTAEQLIRILDRFHAMNLRLVELFHRHRILVTPTTAGPAPLLGSLNGLIDGVETANWVQFTYPFNMTRSPAATVCVGLTGTGLPVGLQLIGPQHGDLVVLRTAAALEAALGFDTLAPVPAA
ncbi:MAG TPA: amidase [Acidimicrobiales bacterium]|jgi:aspartyl-tRNA(Asn)/glutamyl-tRNA(Gln) amidotransferase subunit A